VSLPRVLPAGAEINNIEGLGKVVAETIADFLPKSTMKTGAENKPPRRNPEACATSTLE
jgi:hypothetical protein